MMMMLMLILPVSCAYVVYKQPEQCSFAALGKERNKECM